MARISDLTSEQIKTYRSEIRAAVRLREPEMANILPPGIKPERITEVVMLECARLPDLILCDRVTLLHSIFESLRMGLTPGQDGESYLIPRWNGTRKRLECNFQVGYKGWIKLFWNSGLIDSLDVQTVHANDTYTEVRGTEVSVIHRIDRRLPRGELQFAYARSVVKGSTAPIIYVAGPGEIKQAREAAQTENVWKSNPEWMYMKTALHRIAKLLPKSAAMNRAIALEDAIEAGLSQYDDDDNAPPLSKGKPDIDPPKRKSKPPVTAQDSGEPVQTQESPVESNTGDLGEPEPPPTIADLDPATLMTQIDEVIGTLENTDLHRNCYRKVLFGNVGMENAPVDALQKAAAALEVVAAEFRRMKPKAFTDREKILKDAVAELSNQ